MVKFIDIWNVLNVYMPIQIRFPQTTNVNLSNDTTNSSRRHDTIFEYAPDILVSEIELTLKILKTNKAVGYQCLTALKHLLSYGLRILH